MQFDVRKKKILLQFFKFISVSGVGFLMDFLIYTILTANVGIAISYANMVSAIPAVTWVFVFSTRKIFKVANSKYSLRAKYAIYIVYQLLLLLAVSYLAQVIYDLLHPYVFHIIIIGEYLNVLCKCIITPITMVCNFLVMKYLSEKA